MHSISEYRFRIILTDTGRSPSAWKGIDKNKMVKYCYPSLQNKFDNEFVNFSKEVFCTFCEKISQECGISKNSTYDKNTMCITHAYSKDGFVKLCEYNNNRISLDSKYNNKINELCPNKDDALFYFLI